MPYHRAALGRGARSRYRRLPRPRPCRDPHPANHHRCTRNRFPYAKQIIRITRERLITATDQRSVEVVYAICSLPFEHARLP
ncbi:transposase for IS2404 domain protein, partial [Mycobacterium ulcerans str. Harvey]